MCMEGKNIVLSYRNPDTDGVACSIGMATLLSDEENTWEPMVVGEVGMETQYLLAKYNIPVPSQFDGFENIQHIVLVDTHHKSQLSEDFPYEKVTMVVDHHPNGDDEAFPNAEIRNEKIGAAASIVADELLSQNTTETELLALLGCAIISNTLSFSAPSTTEYDREVYKKINAITSISEQIIDGMFEKRSAILQDDIYSALNFDFKVFDTKAGAVGISQIEAYNLSKMLDMSQVVNALLKIAEERNLNYCMFNGVDIKSKQSLVVAANEESAKLICRIFDLEKYTEPVEFDRILLRKTDFIPPLNL